MITHPDDELLCARLDDELDGDENRSVEKLLQEHPETQARLQSFASVDNLLRQSLGTINDTPLPRIETYGQIAKVSPWKRTVSVPLAAAASIIMLLGGTLFGLMTERLTTPAAGTFAQTDSSSTVAPFIPASELSHAFETFASGTPATLRRANSSGDALINIVRTWKLADGRYCREYEISVDSTIPHEIGVACREHTSEWRIRMRTYPDTRGTFL